jgi:hypothetical protein
MKVLQTTHRFFDRAREIPSKFRKSRFPADQLGRADFCLVSVGVTALLLSWPWATSFASSEDIELDAGMSMLSSLLLLLVALTFGALGAAATAARPRAAIVLLAVVVVWRFFLPGKAAIAKWHATSE